MCPGLQKEPGHSAFSPAGHWECLFVYFKASQYFPSLISLFFCSLDKQLRDLKNVKTPLGGQGVFFFTQTTLEWWNLWKIFHMHLIEELRPCIRANICFLLRTRIFKWTFLSQLGQSLKIVANVSKRRADQSSLPISPRVHPPTVVPKTTTARTQAVLPLVPLESEVMLGCTLL